MISASPEGEMNPSGILFQQGRMGQMVPPLLKEHAMGGKNV